MTTRQRRLLLALILLICGVGRGAYAYHLAQTEPSITTEGDTASYLDPAHELLEHGRFDSSAAEPRPEFLRTPGYPGFVAAVYHLFGDTNTAVLLAQVVASLVTIFLVYLLASRMWSAAAGLVAAAFTALEPLQNYSSATLVTECLGALSLIVVALLAYRALSDARQHVWIYGLLGLATALAILIRPVTTFLPLLILAALIVLSACRHISVRRSLALLAAFIVPLVLCVGGWQLRNQDQVDSYRISGIDAKNVYSFRAAGAIARDEGISFTEAQHRLRMAFGPPRSEESQGAYYRRMYERGMEILKAHPGAALADTVEGFWEELFSVRLKFFGYLDVEHPSDTAIAAAKAGLLAFYGLCVGGVVAVIRRREHLLAHALVIGTPLYFLVVSAGPEALNGRGERFRAPVVPIMIVYGAIGAVTAWQRLRKSSLPAT